MNFFHSICETHKEIINLDHVTNFYKNDQGTFWQIIFNIINGHQMIIYYNSAEEMNRDYKRLRYRVGV